MHIKPSAYPLLAVVASVLPAITAAGTPCGHQFCKASPGTPSWPRRARWDKLNETVEGRLIKPVAPAGVCHQGQPNYDPLECLSVQEEWHTHEWHVRDPVSVMWDNWANWTCEPDPAMPCSTKGYPAYVINATTAEHVKAGIKFGRSSRPLPTP